MGVISSRRGRKPHPEQSIPSILLLVSMSPSQKSDAHVAPQLGQWDAVSIIVGIVIGSSIYVTPSIINGHLGSPMAVLSMWTLGGVLSLIGANWP